MNKIFVGTINPNNTIDIDCISILDEYTFNNFKSLLEALNKLSIGIFKVTYCNKIFFFSTKEILDMLNSTRNITKIEIDVLKKFNISSFDVFDYLLDAIQDQIRDIHFTKKEIRFLKKPYESLFNIELDINSLSYNI